jgi:hypothetical protein
VDGPHLQIHQITFLLLRVGSILFFVRSCKHSGLQQCCTKFFSLGLQCRTIRACRPSACSMSCAAVPAGACACPTQLAGGWVYMPSTWHFRTKQSPQRAFYYYYTERNVRARHYFLTRSSVFFLLFKPCCCCCSLVSASP